MKPLAVLLLCAGITGSVLPGPAPVPSVVVWPEHRVGDEWHVGVEYGGQVVVARFVRVEEARVVYAILAAKMLGGER